MKKKQDLSCQLSCLLGISFRTRHPTPPSRTHPQNSVRVCHHRQSFSSRCWRRKSSPNNTELIVRSQQHRRHIRTEHRWLQGSRGGPEEKLTALFTNLTGPLPPLPPQVLGQHSCQRHGNSNLGEEDLERGEASGPAGILREGKNSMSLRYGVGTRFLSLPLFRLDVSSVSIHTYNSVHVLFFSRFFFNSCMRSLHARNGVDRGLFSTFTPRNVSLPPSRYMSVCLSLSLTHSNTTHEVNAKETRHTNCLCRA